MKIIDVYRLRKRKTLPKRKYHDGDVVEFDFEPNSLDVYWKEVTLIGIVTGVLYEKEDIRYKVQLRDNNRNIFGDMIISEDKIKNKIDENTVTIKCDFCEERIHINWIESDRCDSTDEELERSERLEKLGEWKEWEKFHCASKKCHVLNICPECLRHTKIDMEKNILKCPYDNYDIMQKTENVYV